MFDYADKPSRTEYASYYKPYIDLVHSRNLVGSLIETNRQTLKLLRQLPPEKQDFRYERGKWCIKEIVSHLIDAERIFSYRALRFARHDQTELPGYDHDMYIWSSKAILREYYPMLEEFSLLRQSTIALYRSFDADMLSRQGTANGMDITVNALGFVIAGHELHHMNVIRQRYLD
jgi:uncharacterized damage-inducible protein DinB